MAKITVNKKGIWNEDFIWKGYALAQKGEDNASICKHFKISTRTMVDWKKAHKAFANALTAGKKKPRNGNTSHIDQLREFVHGRLPDDLKPVWSEMMDSDEHGSVLPEKRLAALIGTTKDAKKARQTLWFYAWFECNFNQSEACRRIGIQYSIVQHVWKKEAAFIALFNAMNKIKGDYFEGALVKGVRDGNPYLIAFANKTFNKDRGYGESVDVNVSGNIEHTHVVKIEELDLPLDVRKILLAAVREKEQEQVYELESTG